MSNKFDTLKAFHGISFSNERWDSKEFRCCRLCKTQSKQGKLAHWARGLCRSCYRRLLVSHRLYNDEWVAEHKKIKQRSRRKTGCKEYKTIEKKEDLVFEDLDIETLLDRYDWKCAYSRQPLQGHDFKRLDAFQVEYIIDENNKPVLVPVSRQVNCSKKGLTKEEDLRKWANSVGISYPFKYVSVQDFLNKKLN